ncbi:fkbp-type peptidyl-prolyl cis-trans isomerase [Niveomyces insectorum RCEF 264]|uniref:peptidylprolyl isomerase n=1 Tax=Niveomyces insectorum RCEF 264 TaxID=1081102 RepID=A0A167VDB7_9HYPO|nr:fkbp-type peptidyl-prolyl cis-trans isomerase [Niveomyces insectorum RCEF 264]
MRHVFFSLAVLASTAAGVLADDLKIDVTLPVECERRTQPNDRVSVHYHGSLQSNGKKFDASYDRGAPFSFTIGKGQVIKGMLTVPPEYGYGQRGMGPIPAGSTLIFETELMGIDGVPKPDKIVTKSTPDSAQPDADDSEDRPSSKVAGKIASKIADAAEVVKTVIADTDDGQEHNEL